MTQRGPGGGFPRLSVIAHVDGRRVEFAELGRAGRKSVVRGDYELNVAGGEERRISLRRRDGGEMDVAYLDARVTVPLLNFSRVIFPDCGREYILKNRSLYLRSLVTGVSAPNDGHPFMGFVGESGEAVFSFGLVTFLRESTCRCADPRVSARKAMLGGHDELTMSFRMPSEGWRYGRTQEVCETVFLGRPRPSWFHALRRYTAACRRAHRVCYPVSASAREPTWCTWTAWCSDRLSDETVLANARIASDLGVGTVILDDGWFGPGLDTDDRALNIGDYHPDPAKFRDFPGLIRRLQRDGLNVLLWYAPTCVSPDSRVYPRVRSLLMRDRDGPVMAPNGFYSLCPCNPRAREHVRGELDRMLREYGPDGFKVDLYNTLPAVPCRARHEHDCDSVIEGVHRMMAETWATLREQNPEGLMELKQNYGNVVAAQYGTMVRAGDTAYDSDTNLWRCFYIQAYAPVTHNDYLACSVHDSPRDIAVMMIKLLAGGVPTLSMDLARQPAATLEVIGCWLRYYREHVGLFGAAREPQNGRMDAWEVRRGAQAVVMAVLGALEVSLPSVPETTILNGTGGDRLYVRTGRAPQRVTVRTYDHLHTRLDTRRRRIVDGSELHVPPGGMAAVSA